MNVFWWVITLALLLLGALGYIDKLWPLVRTKKVALILLILFVAATAFQIALTRTAERKQAEDFYSQEIIEVFPRATSQHLLEFFIDDSGNKCVALSLKYEPIEKSLKLWEGGYAAPPATLGFSEKKVIFKYSAYSSYDEYEKEKGPLYQVRYFPRK